MSSPDDMMIECRNGRQSSLDRQRHKNPVGEEENEGVTLAADDDIFDSRPDEPDNAVARQSAAVYDKCHRGEWAPLKQRKGKRDVIMCGMEMHSVLLPLCEGNPPVTGWFRITGSLRGESTGDRWIPLTEGQCCGSLVLDLNSLLNKQPS